MKKHFGILVFVSACLMCLAFLGGMYLGRNLTGSGILISTSPTNIQSTIVYVPATDASSPVCGLIDINSATLSELQLLPGIGPSLAQRILDYRQINGRFSSVADLTKVNGIGQKRLEAILDYITVGG